MKTYILILSCFGVLIAILSESVGKSLYRWHVKTGGLNTGELSFRLTFVIVGALMACLSFLYPFLPDQ
jgi:hypothetical protein